MEKADRWIPNPSFRKRSPYYSDIGLVRLSVPIGTFTKAISPICLPFNMTLADLVDRKAVIRFNVHLEVQEGMYPTIFSTKVGMVRRISVGRPRPIYCSPTTRLSSLPAVGQILKLTRRSFVAGATLNSSDKTLAKGTVEV